MVNWDGRCGAERPGDDERNQQARSKRQSSRRAHIFSGPPPRRESAELTRRWRFGCETHPIHTKPRPNPGFPPQKETSRRRKQAALQNGVAESGFLRFIIWGPEVPVTIMDRVETSLQVFSA